MRSLVLLLFLFSMGAEAKVLIWPFNPSVRFERHENQGLKSRSGYFHGVGLLGESWYGSLEAETFRSTTSEGSISIRRSYQDLKLWGGYGLFKSSAWRILSMAGLGLYKERVETRVGSLEDSSTSDEKNIFGLGAEVLYSSQAVFTFSAGARFYWGEDLDPYPQPSLYLKLGLQF